MWCRVWVFDLYWRSPESGDLWYTSRRLRKTICTPLWGRGGVQRKDSVAGAESAAAKPESLCQRRSTLWSTRVSSPRNFERNVTDFAPHRAPTLVARGTLTCDERVELHREARLPGTHQKWWGGAAGARHPRPQCRLRQVRLPTFQALSPKIFQALSPSRQGQNLALTVLCVPQARLGNHNTPIFGSGTWLNLPHVYLRILVHLVIYDYV